MQKKSSLKNLGIYKNDQRILVRKQYPGIPLDIGVVKFHVNGQAKEFCADIVINQTQSKSAFLILKSVDGNYSVFTSFYGDYFWGDIESEEKIKRIMLEHKSWVKENYIKPTPIEFKPVFAVGIETEDRNVIMDVGVIDYESGDFKFRDIMDYNKCYKTYDYYFYEEKDMIEEFMRNVNWINKDAVLALDRAMRILEDL